MLLACSPVGAAWSITGSGSFDGLSLVEPWVVQLLLVHVFIGEVTEVLSFTLLNKSVIKTAYLHKKAYHIT